MHTGRIWAAPKARKGHMERSALQKPQFDTCPMTAESIPKRDNDLQILRFGPLGSFGQTQPTGTSGKGRAHKIGYEALLLRLIITTRTWLGAANTPSSRLSGRFAHSVRRASSAAGGCAPICRPRHVNRVTRGSAFAVGEFPPKLGTLDAQASKSKVSPSGPRRRLAAFSGLPARP